MTGPYEWMNEAEGRAECLVCGAVTTEFLNRCRAAGIPILSAEAVSQDTVRVTLRLRDLEHAAGIALRSQCELTPLNRRGGARLADRLMHRAVPVLCMLVLMFLLVWSKLYIWELNVTGNETVSTARILNALSECGIRPGSFWPGYTSDNLRSELLLRLPELSWATVNIHGSRAEVIVRERVPKPVLFDADAPFDLTSRNVGFVTRVLALSGTAQVAPGSAVQPGDVLIAGETFSAFSGTRSVHAAGSVTAETYYELSASVPATEYVRAETGKQHSRWALEIGTKRINFYRNSSICGNNCDKIKKTWQCKVKGIFTLPLTLVREYCTEYTLQEQERDKNLMRQALEDQLHERLLETMDGSGTVETEYYSCCERNGTIEVCLRARCSEEISEERPRVQEDLIP